MFYAPDPRFIGFLILYGLGLWGLSSFFGFDWRPVASYTFLAMVALAVVGAVAAALIQIGCWITGTKFDWDDR